ncbi:hypothetical protein QRD43_05955 [Pelomonas sp. APW6]|uniref:Lipoprotein n=1 Tax=Roseateles subflavus TaxID=3053353 RepID=A0ABT7LF21_9BURK|nr:hypothetical protein [Pelomonas sp. APW6]MDL5031446.1 hypothetical protein [Pelomonas sp. APW6]
MRQRHQTSAPLRGALRAGAAALVSLMTACGGGGGGGDAASMTVQGSSLGQGASGLNPDSGTLTVTLRIHGFQDPRGTVGASCGNVEAAGPAVPDWNAAQERLVYTVTYDGLPSNASCKLYGKVQATNATGPNTVEWSIPFTTGASTPMHYGPLLVGLLGRRPFVLDFQAGTPMRRAAPQYHDPSVQRPPPEPLWFGTALSTSGRIPVAAMGSSVGGPLGFGFLFNPLTLQYATPSSFDALPAGHEVSFNPIGFGNGWDVNNGGVGPAPTPTSIAWTADGQGGWFYVEDATADTLRRRSAAGVSTVVHQQPGERFGSMRVFSR